MFTVSEWSWRMVMGMRGLIGIAMMLVLALCVLGSAAMAEIEGHPSRRSPRAPQDQGKLEFGADTQALEDGFLGGARRSGIANDPDLARPVVKLGFETSDAVMALGENQGVDALENDRLAACRV